MQTETPEPSEEQIPESPQSPFDQLDTLTDAELTELTRSLLNPAPSPEPEQEEQQPEPETDQGETQPEEGLDPETETEPDKETETEDDQLPTKGKQIRLKGPDFQFATLRKSGVSPEEAARIAYGISPSQPAPAQVEAETVSAESKEPDIDDRLTEISARLEALEDEIVDATDLVDSDRAKALKRERSKLNEQRTDLMVEAKLRVAETRKQLQSQAESEYNSHVTSALTMYPDLADEKSAFYKKSEEIRQQLVATKNPALEANDFPVILAQMTGNALRIPPNMQKQPANAQPAKSATPTPSGRPAQANPQPLPTRGTPPVKPMTDADLDAMSPAELTLFLRKQLARK